jgi:hypothetical protein
MCEGKVYNNGVKSCDKDGIIQLTYENCNRIIYYHTVVQTVDVVNNRDTDIKYKLKNSQKFVVSGQIGITKKHLPEVHVQNQKLSTLAMECLKKEFCNLPLSSMNDSGDYIFSSDYIRNCQFNG